MRRFAAVVLMLFVAYALSQTRLLDAVSINIDLTPSPTPIDELPPSPIPGNNVSVLIIEETSERKDLPESQRELITSVAFRRWCKEHDVSLIVADVDDPLTYDPQQFRDAKSLARQTPWVIAGNSETGFSEPLPESTDALIAKLEGLL